MRRLALPLLFPLLFVSSCGEQGEVAVEPSSNGVESSTEISDGEVNEALDVAALAKAGDLEKIVDQLQPRFDAGTITESESQLLAEARLSQNEIPKAVKVLTTALKANPSNVQASLLLSDVYGSIGQPRVGLKALQDSRKNGGSDADLALAIGLVQGRLGNLKEAEAEFVKAREAGADPDDVNYNLAIIVMEQGDFAQAETIYSELLKADPGKHYVRRELARAKFNGHQADMDEVRSLCNEVLEANAEDWRAWELLGDVEMHDADFMAAKTYYTSALEFGSKEIGNNPPRVEEKYTNATLALREEFKAQGLLPEDSQGAKGGAPPLPDGVQERMREARREKAAQAESAGSDG